MSITQLLLNGDHGIPPREDSAIAVLRRAVKRQSSVTLSESQAEALLSMLQRPMGESDNRDPFARGKPVLNVGDVELLGMRVEDQDNGARPSEGERHGDDHDDPELLKRQPVFGMESAIVAPDSTPNTSTPIPDSVLASLAVLRPDAEEHEYDPQARNPGPVPGTHEAESNHAAAMGGAALPATGAVPRHVQESAGSDASVALATVRSLRAQTSTLRGKPTRRPRAAPLTEAEQKAARKLR